MVLPALHRGALTLLFHRPRFLCPFCDSIDIELSFTFNRHIHWGQMDGRMDGWPVSWQQRRYLEKQKRSFAGNGKKLMMLAWCSADRLSIMMCIHYLRTPWLPVTCPFFHPSFFLNDSIHISVTVIQLCLLLRKWKSSIWPLYLTSGLVLCCGGLQADGAVAPFHVTILSLYFFLIVKPSCQD